MTPTATAAAAPDLLRAQLLAGAEAAMARVAPGLPAEAAGLVGPLFASLDTAELAAEPPEALAEAAASLLSGALRRRPGEASVRLVAPRRGVHPVAEIVTDDMPFLVDSVAAELTRLGRSLRLVIHPVLSVQRDVTGALQGVASDGAGTRELSLIHI